MHFLYEMAYYSTGDFSSAHLQVVRYYPPKIRFQLLSVDRLWPKRVEITLGIRVSSLCSIHLVSAKEGKMHPLVPTIGVLLFYKNNQVI